jgi:hypothetical protein
MLHTEVMKKMKNGGLDTGVMPELFKEILA